jgi:cytoskeleton protein RodZ
VALGGRLRQAREASGQEASVLADRLRIGVEQLEALEAGDRSRLPEPVFVIAQARRVAGALQLDIGPELQALRASGELDAASGAPLRPSPAPAAPSTSAASALRVRPSVRPWWWAAAVVLLLAAVGVGWRLRTAVVPARSDQPAAAPAPGATALPAASGERGGDRAVIPTAEGLSASPGGTAEPVAKAGTVVLASREPSWVEVRRPDGSTAFRGLLQGARVFPLADGLEVLAGRPDLVTSRVGSEPARVLGPISDVRWRSLPADR